MVEILDLIELNEDFLPTFAVNVRKIFFRSVFEQIYHDFMYVYNLRIEINNQESLNSFAAECSLYLNHLFKIK